MGLQRRVDELERGEVKRLRTERDAAKKEASDFLYFYLVEKVCGCGRSLRVVCGLFC